MQRLKVGLIKKNVKGLANREKSEKYIEQVEKN